MPIGAHVSTAGRVYDAIPRAMAIGCECVQIFVGSPRQWRLVEYDPADVAEFRRRRGRAGLEPLVAHASYLVNFASADPELHRRSVESLTHTVRGVDALDGLAAITHLGSTRGARWDECCDRIALALRTVLAHSSRAMVLLEGSAGGTIGGTFEQLRDILDAAGRSPRLGVCLDTAHLFAAGWDVRTPRGVADMVDAFDRRVGLRWLRVLHLNDSKAPLGSRLDRHENIGEGSIGRGGFRAVFGHPALRDLPALIETPGFDHHGPDRRNVMTLKRLRAAAAAARPFRSPTARGRGAAKTGSAPRRITGAGPRRLARAAGPGRAR
ncbi:MAG TPA: deoxyribonuclease IV [bacterium]|nr:deoxyribonuclease IV [bacterium]